MKFYCIFCSSGMVLTVDWQNGAKSDATCDFYWCAAANTQYVGTATELVVKQLKDKIGVKLNIHCIGHSLGAWTCQTFSNKYYEVSKIIIVNHESIVQNPESFHVCLQTRSI